jgi:GNAT superfamily N-acetyltransferase
MDAHRATIPLLKILETPSHQEIRVVSEWLATHRHENPDLEIALNVVLRDQIIPHERGGLIAIAHKASTLDAFTLQEIQGIVMAKPGNTNVLIESCDRSVAEALFNLIQSRGCPQRVFTSGQTKPWIHPLLLQHYQLQREHDQQVLICTQPIGKSEGRWAVPEDKPALHRYAEAYLAERGSGSLDYPWDEWIQQRRVAVLEHNEEIVAIVRKSETSCHAVVVAPFTFPQFRRQGFARRLLAFFVKEMLQKYAAVKLWVDQENVGAIALYSSLKFHQIGNCYTGYFNCVNQSTDFQKFK